MKHRAIYDITSDMSPFLGPETETKIIPEKKYKFVSDKGKIAFEEPVNETKPLHDVIANNHELGTPVSYDPATLEVDDAGYLERQKNGVLLFWGQSSSCRPRDEKNAKTNTQKLANQLTGKAVDVKEGIW